MNILVIDIGGNNVKLLATGQNEARRFASGSSFTPEQMVQGVLQHSQDWSFDALSIGYPSPIVDNHPGLDPINLGTGWVDFDYAAAFGKPVKFINDAAMQALGSYQGGKMLFLGLGTGLGNTMIVDNLIIPMELGHLPYRKGTFEDYVGQRGLERLGKQKWNSRVIDVVTRLRNALLPDEVVLGGGNVKKLEVLPENVRLVSNNNAFIGGFKLWE
jgi:polyphosphate glucokinase